MSATPKTLAVIMPCYNEAATLAVAVERVLAADSCGLSLQLHIVDDGSVDDSAQIAAGLATAHANVSLHRLPHNQGKGAAIRYGMQQAQEAAHVVLIQDGDLEYNPADYPKLLAPIVAGQADVVFGSRFIGGQSHRVLYYWHSVGNRLLTTCCNAISNLNLTDMECGYKVFRAEIAQQLLLQESRFGIEPEMVIKTSRLRPAPRIYEVGVQYAGRTYAEGKKIGWRDGVAALYCIGRYGLGD